MGAAELTAVIAGITALLSSVLVPLYLRRQDRRDKADDRRDQADQRDEVSWQSINKALREERDSLVRRLDEKDTAHRIEIAAINERYRLEIEATNAKWMRQMEVANGRIRSLEDEVTRIYRAFYGKQGE